MENHKRRRWLLGLLLLLVVSYGGYRVFRTDPAVKKVRELRQTLSAANLTPEQRRDTFRQLREAMEKLPPEKRERMRKEMAEDGRRRFEEQLRQYHALSPAEKTRYLDRQIDRAESMRRQRPPGSPSPGTTSPAVFASTRGGPAAGNRPPRSAEERERQRKQRLDETTPEFRALRDQYFKDMQTRRQQRGLTSFGRR